MSVRNRFLAVFALAILALASPGAGVVAQVMPAARADALDLQFRRLLSAQTRAAAAMAEQEVWRLWFTGPDAEITDSLAAAVELMRTGQYDECDKLLSGLILKAPNYAELWNQRAFARFLAGKLDLSLKDIDRTLALEPRHFGALAGRAQIEVLQGRLGAARKTMGKVGRVNPWLARSSPIPADPPPPPPVVQRDL